MDSATEDIARLQKLDRKLKLAGLINIGLLLLSIVFTVVMYSQLVALGHKDPDDLRVSQEIHKMLHENKLTIVFGYVCTGLMLLWMPARAICLFKLKKLRKQAGA